MKAFVFTDERLREFAGQFVWLEINIDKAENAAFRKKFPVKALPTYLVIDPRNEFPMLRWVGGATVTKLSEMLVDVHRKYGRSDPGESGELAANEPSDSGSDPTSVDDDGPSSVGDSSDQPGEAGHGGKMADALLERADLLYAANKTEAASAIYRKAIEHAPAEWPSYSRAVEALLILQSIEGQCADAVELAREAYPRLAGVTSVAVVAGVGLDCALALPEDDPEKVNHLAFFEDAAGRAVADLSISIPADDRSGVYISLYSARQAADDSTGARLVASDWAQFLETTAAEANSPDARTVFDSHRLSAYLRLGQPERAISMLEESQRDFPEDYNPPARLAVAYRAMERWDAGLTAIDAAIDRAYGPRKIGLLRTQAQLFVSKGEPDSARVVLEGALQFAENLPEGLRSERRIESVQSDLAKLDAEQTDRAGSE